MKTLAEYGAETFANCERRQMHELRLPTLDEMQTKAHAECSEVFEAWLKRSNSITLRCSALQIGNHAGQEFVAEYNGLEGVALRDSFMFKPEGVAAELADVVLTLAYIAHRWPEYSSTENITGGFIMSGGVVQMLSHVHRRIAFIGTGGNRTFDLIKAVLICECIAGHLSINLDAAIERKHAHNNVRPATTRRL